MYQFRTIEIRAELTIPLIFDILTQSFYCDPQGSYVIYVSGFYRMGNLKRVWTSNSPSFIWHGTRLITLHNDVMS